MTCKNRKVSEFDKKIWRAKKKKKNKKKFEKKNKKELGSSIGSR